MDTKFNFFKKLSKEDDTWGVGETLDDIINKFGSLQDINTKKTIKYLYDNFQGKMVRMECPQFNITGKIENIIIELNIKNNRYIYGFVFLLDSRKITAGADMTIRKRVKISDDDPWGEDN